MKTGRGRGAGRRQNLMLNETVGVATCHCGDTSYLSRDGEGRDCTVSLCVEDMRRHIKGTRGQSELSEHRSIWV